MSDIPFLDELGRRLDAATRTTAPRKSPSGPIIAAFAFAATFLVIGGFATWASLGVGTERLAHEATTATSIESKLSLEALAERLPLPRGLAMTNDPHGDAPTGDLITRKFSGEAAGTTAAVSVILARVDHPAPTITSASETRTVLLSEHLATMTSPGRLITMTWQLTEDIVIEITSRGWSGETAIDYATRVDSVLSAELR